MRFRFKTEKLLALYTNREGAKKYPRQVVESFFEVMAIVDAAKDERDLYAFKGLRFEKLSGRRKDERSLRLTGQWRLTLTIEHGEQGNCLVIQEIVDYHPKS